MSKRKPRKKKPPRKEPCELLLWAVDGVCPHGEPMVKGKPAFCLLCTRPVRGIRDRVFREATSQELKALKDGPAPKREPVPFAQRKFGTRSKKGK